MEWSRVEWAEQREEVKAALWNTNEHYSSRKAHMLHDDDELKGMTRASHAQLGVGWLWNGIMNYSLHSNSAPKAMHLQIWHKIHVLATFHCVVFNWTNKQSSKANAFSNDIISVTMEQPIFMVNLIITWALNHSTLRKNQHCWPICDYKIWSEVENHYIEYQWRSHARWFYRRTRQLRRWKKKL